MVTQRRLRNLAMAEMKQLWLESAKVIGEQKFDKSYIINI